MTFETSNRLNKWIEEHSKKCTAPTTTAGERFVFEFIPTGIIEIQSVKCMCYKEEFTDYVD